MATFLLPAMIMEDTAISTDSVNSPDSASGLEATDSSPVVETSETVTDSPAGSATASDVTTSAEVQVDDDPLKDVPTVEELQALAERKVPHAQNVLQLRTAYEKLKPQLEAYKPLDAWKPIAETIGDPALAQSAHELVSAIYTPDPNNPNSIDPTPFLTKIEEQSPGSVDAIFSKTLTFQIPDAQGNPSTVVRELVKSWGLNPDRIDDYRNIDTLRASGVVRDEDLSKIPEKYHEAFRAMSSDAREDLLDLLDSKPLVAEENLRNAQRALATEKFEQEQRDRQKSQDEASEREFQQKLTADIEQDIFAEVKTIHDSIHQKSLSQYTFSSDPVVDALEKAKIMATLATLQIPAYRFVAEDALKAVGVSLTASNGTPSYDELANSLETSRASFVSHKARGHENGWEGKSALAASSNAKQMMLTRLNDYALRLAKASGQRAATAGAQVNDDIAAAAARFVPNGNGQRNSGFTNPYDANPHPFGSQEYKAFNRRIDQELRSAASA